MQETHTRKYRRRKLPTFDDWERRASYLGLKGNRSGKRLSGPCPKCGGSKDSTRFSVSKEKGIYCFVCCPTTFDAALGIAIAAGFEIQTELVEQAEKIDHAALRRPPPNAEPRPTKEVKFLLAAAEPVPTAGTARDYLAGRQCWPPAEIDAPLPETLKWLDASKLADKKAGLKAIPKGTIGALAFIWQSLKQPAKPCALSLMALAENAERLLWYGKVKTLGVGQRKATAFAARPVDNFDTHLAEGELDALALTWENFGGCLATGGTGGLETAAQSIAGCVVIHADGDYAGRSRATRVADEAGTNCSVEYCAAGHDPASELAAAISHWEMVHQLGGLNENEAAIAAWKKVVPKLKRQMRND